MNISVNEEKLRSKKYQLLLLVIILSTIALTFYLVEKLLFTMCKIFYYDFLIIFAFLLSHVLIARYVVKSIIFPGSSSLIQKLIRREHGK